MRHDSPCVAAPTDSPAKMQPRSALGCSISVISLQKLKTFLEQPKYRPPLQQQQQPPQPQQPPPQLPPPNSNNNFHYPPPPLPPPPLPPPQHHQQYQQHHHHGEFSCFFFPLFPRDGHFFSFSSPSLRSSASSALLQGGERKTKIFPLPSRLSLFFLVFVFRSISFKSNFSLKKCVKKLNVKKKKNA